MTRDPVAARQPPNLDVLLAAHTLVRVVELAQYFVFEISDNEADTPPASNMFNHQNIPSFDILAAPQTRA